MRSLIPDKIREFGIKASQKGVCLLNFRGSVLSGPFKGMRYISTAHMSAYYPKVLGTYEMELAEVIQKLLEKRPKTLINIGAAEGYFAVGIARALPSSEILAFESSSTAREMLRELASINGVLARIQIQGECTIDKLQAELKEPSETALVVDIEGGEDKLLDLKKIPNLGTVTILVEVHERGDETLGEKLRVRFKDTHVIQEIKARERNIHDLPFKIPASFQGNFIGRSIKLMMDEQRGDGRLWLYLEPKR